MTDWFGYKKELRFILRSLRKGDRILDIGCGTGVQLTRPIANRGFEIIGVDMHKPTIDYAKSHNDSNARFICGRFEDQNLGVFDVVICSFILEHINYPKPFLKEVKKVLSPDGILFLSVPNGYGAFEIEKKTVKRIMKWIVRNRLVRMQDDAPPMDDSCPHVQSFTMKKLKRVLNDTGFEVLEVMHGTLIGSGLTNMVIAKFPKFADWNVTITDKLPSWMVSLWHLKCKHGG